MRSYSAISLLYKFVWKTLRNNSNHINLIFSRASMVYAYDNQVFFFISLNGEGSFNFMHIARARARADYNCRGPDLFSVFSYVLFHGSIVPSTGLLHSIYVCMQLISGWQVNYYPISHPNAPHMIIVLESCFLVAVEMPIWPNWSTFIGFSLVYKA